LYGIAVSTDGAACGPTFTMFVIDDPVIRERALLEQAQRYRTTPPRLLTCW
jgi:hypothetical protein